jgi:hypothetical protein
MVNKTLIDPRRKRRIPAHFSWVDHRFVRKGYCRQCSTEALGLYLFLLAVSDCEGLSYYGDKSISREINCAEDNIGQLRRELISAGLIAFNGRLYQVLDLAKGTPKSGDQPTGTYSVGKMLEKMFGGGTDD